MTHGMGCPPEMTPASSPLLFTLSGISNRTAKPLPRRAIRWQLGRTLCMIRSVGFG